MALPPIVESATPSPAPSPLPPIVEAPASGTDWAARKAARQARIQEHRRRITDPIEKFSVTREEAAQHAADLGDEAHPVTLEDTARNAPAFANRQQDLDAMQHRERMARAKVAPGAGVLSTPGVGGAVRSLASTAQAAQSLAGGDPADRQRAMSAVEAPAEEAKSHLGPVGRFAFDAADAIGGIVPDIGTMMIPGAGVAKAGRAVAAGLEGTRGARIGSALASDAGQVALSSTGFGGRAYLNTLDQTGSHAQAAVQAVIEGVIPAAFGKSGAERMLLPGPKLDAALSKLGMFKAALREGPPEMAEELTQELAGAVTDYANGDLTALDEGVLARRLALAGLGGFVGGVGITAGGHALAGAGEAVEEANFDRAIQEAAARQAALMPGTVGSTHEALAADNLRVVGTTPEGRPIFDVAPPLSPVDAPENLPPEPVPQPVAPEAPVVAEPQPDAPPAQPVAPDAAALESQILELQRQARGAFSVPEKASLIARANTLAAQKAKIDTQAAAGVQGQEIMAATAAAEAASKVNTPASQASAEAARAKVDRVVAGKPDPTKVAMKKAAPADPATLVAEAAFNATPEAEELDRLDKLLASPTLLPEDKAKVQQKKDDLIRRLLTEPVEDTNPNIVQGFDEPQDTDQPETPKQRRLRLMDEILARRYAGRAEPDPMVGRSWMPRASEQAQRDQTAAVLRQKRAEDQQRRDTGMDEPDDAEAARVLEMKRAAIPGAPIQPMTTAKASAPAREGAQEERAVVRSAPLTPEERATAKFSTGPKNLDTEAQPQVFPAPPAPPVAAQAPGEIRGAEQRIAAEEKRLDIRSGTRVVRPVSTEGVGPGDISQRGSAGAREATSLESHEANLERDKTNLESSVRLRIGLPTAQVGVPASERAKHGETVLISPIESAARLTAKQVVNAETGEPTHFAPPAFYMGKVITGPASGKFTVLALKPSHFKPGVHVLTGTNLVVPNIQATTAELGGKLAALRAEARDLAARTERGDAVDPAELLRINEEIKGLVAQKLNSHNAPYWMAMRAPTAKAVDAAARAGDAAKVRELLAPYFFGSFEDAHAAAWKMMGESWAAVSAVDSAVTEEGSAAVTEHAGEEGNAGFTTGKRDLDSLVTEDEKSQAEKDAKAAEGIDSSRSSERNAARAALNRRNPGDVKRRLQGWGQEHNRSVQAARRYFAALRSNDIVDAWITASMTGDTETAKLALAAIRSLEDEARIEAHDTAPDVEFDPAKEKAKAERKLASANPFLAETFNFSPKLHKAQRAMPAIPGLGSMHTSLQAVVRAAQLRFPHIRFEIIAQNAERKGRYDPNTNTISLAYSGEKFNDMSVDQKRETLRRFVGTVGHELFHATMRNSGIQNAVFGSLHHVLGEDGVKRMVDGARAGWVKMEKDGEIRKTSYYADLWRKFNDHALKDNMTEADASTYAYDKVAEELVAMAFTKHMQNGLFADDGSRAEGALIAAKAIFTAPEMAATLDSRILLTQLGITAVDPERRTALAQLQEQFANLDAVLESASLTQTEIDEAKQRERDQDQLGTENLTYQMGQDASEDPDLAPRGRTMDLGETWHQNVRELSDIVTAAVRAASGRVVWTDPRTKMAYPVDTWTPLTKAGEKALAEMLKVSPEVAKIAKLPAMDAPADVEEARKERAGKRFLGTYAGDLKANQPVSAKERLKSILDPIPGMIGWVAWRRRYLGMARDPASAKVVQLLDVMENRLEHSGSRAEAAIHMIASPLEAARAAKATEAQLLESNDIFGDYLLMRSQKGIIERGLLSGDFREGKTRILTNKIGGSWAAGTDLALFYEMYNDANARYMANPTARAMIAHYDAQFDALRAEAKRLGTAEDLPTDYYHHQVLQFTSEEAKKARREHLDATGDTAAPGRSGAILKGRSGESVADINLNPWQATMEAVEIFERIMAKAEFSKGLMDRVSAHNTVTANILAQNRAEVDHILDAAEFKKHGESHTRLLETWGSLLRSDHTLPDRPWLAAHSAVLMKLEAAFAGYAKTDKASVDALENSVTVEELRALTKDAIDQSPETFQRILENSVLGSTYLDPFDYEKAWAVDKSLFPEGFESCPAPFTSSIPAATSGEGYFYDAILDRAAARNGRAAIAPQAVLPRDIVKEVGSEMKSRQAIKDQKQSPIIGTARRWSVKAQLSSPLTVPRYLAMNYIGNTMALIAHDPASLAYIAAAKRVMFKFYKAPHKLTRQEALVVQALQRAGLLNSGTGIELLTSNDYLTKRLMDLTTHRKPEHLPIKAWKALIQGWDRWINPQRRFADDFARVVQAMREMDADPYLHTEVGDVLRLGFPGRTWKALTGWATGSTGIGLSQQAEAMASDLGQRTAAGLAQDLATGRNVMQYAAARVRGTTGNYTTLSRFGESIFGRGFINVFFGYTENVTRTTILSVVNDLSYLTPANLKANPRAAASKGILGTLRGLTMLAVGPMLVRALNAALWDDEKDDDYAEFLASDKTSPFFDLYLGNWGGKVRVMGLSTVVGDTFRNLGVDNAPHDIARAVEYAGKDDWGSVKKAMEHFGGRHASLFLDPQIAYLDMLPTAAGYRWNAQKFQFVPTYDKPRQLLQPWGIGGLYDYSNPATGQNGVGLATDLLARPFDPEGGQIQRAKGLIDSFNQSQGIGSTAAGTLNDEARLRNSLRQALLRGDEATAAYITDKLYNLDDRAVGPDNLLKSFGASNVYHRLGSDGKSSRTEMREKLHRWLTPADRELVARADALQDATFNPYKNPLLMSVLRAHASTPDLKFRTARVLSNTLATAVAENRTENGRPGHPGGENRAIREVSEELGVPAEQVRAAIELRKLNREISAQADPERAERLREKYMRKAEAAGFTD